MKKTVSMLIAAVIILASALSFASCGGGEGIVGKWVSPIDFSKAMEAASESSGGLLDGLFDTSSIAGETVDMIVEFESDGTYNATMDMDQLKGIMKSVFEDMFSSIAEASGMSLDDMLKAQGYDSLDALIDKQMEESGEDQYKSSGKYTFENGELDINGTVVKAELAGDTLTFTEVVSAANEDSESFSFLQNELLPLVFKRD